MQPGPERPILQVVIATTRPNRIGLPIGTWVADHARAHGAFAVEVADLGEIALPMFDEPDHPARGEYVGAHTRAWSERIARSDAFILVTAEYNHSIPASLKNAIDYLHREWLDKPAAVVSYGGVSGGSRAAVALAPILAALRMPTLAGGVAISGAPRMVADGVFQPTGTNDEQLTAVLDALARVTPALKALRS